MAELFDQIDELRRTPGKVAVATLVNTRGTTPRKEGAKMLVGDPSRLRAATAWEPEHTLAETLGDVLTDARERAGHGS